MNKRDLQLLINAMHKQRTGLRERLYLLSHDPVAVLNALDELRETEKILDHLTGRYERAES